MEKQILQVLFLSRQSYDSIRTLVEEKEFSPQGQLLLKEIDKFYSKDAEAVCCDSEIILNRIVRNNPKIKEVFQNLIGSFSSSSISESNVRQELLDFKRHLTGQKLAASLLDGRDNVYTLIDEYLGYKEDILDDTTEKANVVCAPDITSVIERSTGDKLLKLAPKSLNDAVDGGVPDQTHIVVFAVPEEGKSAFCINQICVSAGHEHKVLFIDNEDPMDNTIVRIVSRLTGMLKQDIIANPEEAHSKAMEKGYGNITIASLAPGTLDEIDGLIEEYKPRLLVVNQIRHLYFRGIEGEVQQLTMAGKGMRKLVKKHNIVGISVHQAADSATGKSVLERGDVYMSNTSLPGDADILIGIGSNDDMKNSGMRNLSLCKNKRNGNHAIIPVIFDQARSKFSSIK